MMLSCHIVKDLLPSYLEQLTSPETNAAVEEHLASCESCRAAKAAMEAELPLETAPAPRLNFLKKLKRRQLVGALLSLLATLLIMAWFCGLEYFVDVNDSAAVEALILEDVSYDGRYRGADIQLLDRISLKNQVLLLYRLDDENGYRGKGVAWFSKGLLGKYRPRSIGATTWELDSYAPVRIGGRDYLLVANVNEPVGAETLRIYAGYHDPAYEGDPMARLPETCEPVYEGPAQARHFFLAPLEELPPELHYYDNAPLYYDADGNQLDSVEIARAYYGMENSISGGLLGAPSSLQPLCFWLVLTALLGLVMIRYFLIF